MDRVSVSKYLSYLLRHAPGPLDVDRQGYAPVGQVIERLRMRFPSIDGQHLRRLADSDSRQRFDIRGDRIRARYGHSIAVDPGWPADNEVPRLYHGTSKDAVPSILEHGLHPRSRQMVHLSSSPEAARRVGRRHGTPVVLHIDAAGARRRGVTFHRATTQVYLAAYVPAQHISLRPE